MQVISLNRTLQGEIYRLLALQTMKEYRKHIEKDSALERRFQPVIIDEPSVSDTIEILKGIKDYYEDYHRVSISEDVLKKAVMLSERYITDRFLPDKAIDVIDEAGSRANLMNEGLVELEALKNELAMVNEEKEQAVSADSIEEYQKAADYKVRECKLREQIAEIEAKTKIVDITEEDIAHVIESWTKIPVQRITEIEAEKLLKLEDRIHKSIIGQKEAVHAISKAIRRARSGMKKRKKPSSFIFVGPTGVGKTELVRVLSKELFESEEAMIRLDMSEYMEKHAVSKLIGSPPGYIGYDDGGQLTEKVRRKPYSVILMDEIEKAHSDVFNMLLQIMEDGRLTDSHGRMVNFENTILIMTSNAGTGSKSNNIGFNNDEYSAMKDKVEDVLKSIFKPEFLNRVDETVVFKELDKKELKEIIKLMLSEVQKELAHKELKLEYTDKAVDFILETGYDIKYGARPLRRTIEKHIEDELAEQFLKGTYKPGDTIKIDSDEKRLIYS
jgi:ATP-dependent Clp protease ATP-binding subunit ClpC